MSKIDLHELIPGGNKYDAHQYLKPTDVRFCHEHYILLFPDGFGIYHKDNVQYPRHYVLKDLEMTYLDIHTKYRYKRGSNLNPNQPIQNDLCYPEFCSVDYTEPNIILVILVSNKFIRIVYDTKRKKIIHSYILSYFYETDYKINRKGIIAYPSGFGIEISDFEGHKIDTFKIPNNQGSIELPSRNEFGIDKLLFWSPDAQKIAFYLTNDREVSHFPVGDLAQQNVTYPFAGEKSETVTIGIIDTVTKKVAFIDCKQDPVIQEAQQTICHDNSYLTGITWSPDSNHILLFELERSQKYYQAKKYSAETGEFEEFLFDEASPTYVEPEYPFYFINEHQFVYLSQATGHNHLYSYDLTTKERLQITSGDWDINGVYVVKKNLFYYSSSQRNRIGNDIYSFDFTTQTSTLISQEIGTHQYSIDRKSGLWLDQYSSMQNPGHLNFNNHIIPLHCSHKRKNLPYSVEVGTISIDNDPIYYKAVLPKKITEKKKYPVVFYIYGGPHVRLIQDHWGSSTKGFEEMMAQEGYFVFMIDPHGSAKRGRAFEEKIYQNINVPQVADYDRFIDWLLEESPYKEHINPKKMAIYGWSFGGYMTISMLLNSRHTFQIGVAGGAVVDWRMYEVMYTERYMGIRNAETEAIYKKFDLKEHIHKLKTPLYLIHCDSDTTVLWRNTLSLLKKANSIKNLCTLIDYYVFPGHGHNVQGIERVALMEKVKGVIRRYI
ncbi:MAG: DPP IV N-terminal domain-containing protein [Paludibacteraceae bacterium]|nr:DPP IV N-terminal domain-containing protein [Paludibacteraceae bacterium]